MKGYLSFTVVSLGNDRTLYDRLVGGSDRLTLPLPAGRPV